MAGLCTSYSNDPPQEETRLRRTVLLEEEPRRTPVPRGLVESRVNVHGSNVVCEQKASRRE